MPVLSGVELLATLSGEFDADAVEVHDVVRVASPQIEPQHWALIHAKLQALLDRNDIVGAVVTHGTATLEETAWFLDLTLATDKPVVVTGAQRNASESDFDGPRNLREALCICRSLEACGRGVLVALNSHINAAREVTKTHTLDVETFQSNEWGYLGAVLHDRVVFHRRPERRLHLPLASEPLARVEIVSMYAGADGAMVDAAADSGARGLVVQSVASGHVNAPMQQAIQRAMARGVAVVIATRIPRGGTRVGYGFEGSSAKLVEAGAVLSGDLSAWKARIVLMLALQAGRADSAALTQLFLR